MTVNYVYLGYGVTDENGVAKLDHNASGTQIDNSYTGTGAGEIDVVASLDGPSDIGSGSVQSEPYTLWDTLFYDEATSSDTKNNTGWTMYRGTISYEDSAKIVMNSGEASMIYTRTFTIGNGMAIEFDLNANYSSTLSQIFRICNDWSTVGSATRSNLNLANETWTHIKITLQDGEGLIYRYDGDTNPVSFSYTSLSRFYFFLENTSDFVKYKNFKTYSI